MRPKKPETTGSTDLFRAWLDQIINLKHFQTWCSNEVLRRVLTDVANELRDKGVLGEEESFIDATFAMAKGGGAENCWCPRHAQHSPTAQEQWHRVPQRHRSAWSEQSPKYASWLPP